MAVNKPIFNDPYLRRLDGNDLAALHGVLDTWALNTQAFHTRLDKWFGNFSAVDKPLALKLILNFDYYNESRFDSRLTDFHDDIRRVLFDLGYDEDNFVIVVADGQGDSSNRHAYDMGKALKKDRKSILTTSELSGIDLSEQVLIFFNDTHGSGNQFIREVGGIISGLTPQPLKIVILAINIAEKAMQSFQASFPNAFIRPDVAARTASDIFTGSEYLRLVDLGRKVYSKHPEGYGETALLTAYYYQCPNNTLPIVWADGSNNRVDGRGYPWSPLFPYKPKPSTGLTRVAERRDDLTNQTTSANGNMDFGVGEQSQHARIFLHFLDHYFLEMLGVSPSSKVAFRECRFATRLAFLSGTVIVPAASYFESAIGNAVINEYRPLFHEGRIRITGSGTSIHEYLERKLVQYPKEDSHYRIYKNAIETGAVHQSPPFLPREGNATKDITERWLDLGRTEKPDQMLEVPSNMNRLLHETWDEIPERLDGKPFIVEYVEPLLAPHSPSRFLTNCLHSLVNTFYYDGFTSELGCGFVTDLVYLNSKLTFASHSSNLSYQRVTDELRKKSLVDQIESATIMELEVWRHRDVWIECLRAGLDAQIIVPKG